MRPPAWVAPVAIVLAAAVTWLPTWSAPYAEDDFLFLEAVSRPGAPPPWHYLAHEGVMDHHFRPLADPLVFAFLHAVAETDPVAYHLVLLLAHALAGWLVVRLGAALGLPPAAGLLAGLLYVTRDFSFPSLVWASGFSDIGSAAAALGALTAAARWGRAGGGGRLALGVALMVLAQLVKETAVVTMALVPLVLALAGVPWRRVVLGTVPFVVAGTPIALVALRVARFAEAGGQALYELSVGPHVFTLWPVYAAWSVAGVRELLDAPVVRTAIVIAGYAGLIVLLAGAVRGRTGARRGLGLIVLWVIAGAAPALLAPQRVHTNYLALAAVGPILALAWGVKGLHARVPGPAVGAAVLVLVAGPVLAHAKAHGRLASGGWVDVAKARRLEALVDRVEQAVPAPVPGARLLIFGGVSVDVRVLGDPRGTGFGPQQVLASAVRVAYGRHDLEVLSLPPLEASPPAAYEAVHALLRERPDATRVIVARPDDAHDVTARALEVLRGGGGPWDLARALRGP